MSGIINIFIIVSYISFLMVTSFFFFLIALVIRLLVFPFDRKMIISNLFSSFWASFYLWCIPGWSITKSGLEKASLKKNYIIVANHQSQMDILLAFNLFLPFRWVSKREVFNIPFIGWNMLLNKYVGLKRGDKDSIKKMMEQCESILKQGCSLFFFPEGTRSETGELRQFKPGAFILAKKTKTNILPVIMQGTNKIMPKNSAQLILRGRMSIKVLDEISYKEFDDKTPEETAAIVRDLFVRNMEAN